MTRPLSPNAPLARVPYAAVGFLLLLVKVAIDASIARHYGRAYSLLFYVDPTSAPLLREDEVRGYWLALCYATVPFAAVGVLLTLRRLRDAGASPWLAAFFFVPFANLLFFLATALLPPHRAASRQVLRADQPFRAQDLVVETAPPKARSRPAAILYAAALGSVAALGGFAVSVGLLGRYGYGLALGTPLIAGFVAGAWVPRLLPGARITDALLSSFFTFVVTFSFVVVFALEGLGCLALFVPVLVVPALLGTVLGFAIGRSLPKREHALATGAGGVLLLVCFGAETLAPPSPHTAPMVETSLTIDAPPETVWPLLIRVDDMKPPVDLPFSAGIAYPLRATLDAEGVGAVRRCEFNTGTVLETVSVWAPPTRLRFVIDAQPDPLRELTLYRTVRQPHLDGAVRNRIGEFELVPLDGGRRTKLIGRSWYETSLHPTFYWEAYSETVIHAIHLRVMRHVQTRARAAELLAGEPPR